MLWKENEMLQINKNIPSLIKYMGSKAEIIEYVVAGLNDVHKENQTVCDLFAGSATLSGALRGNKIDIISNDIQQYSQVLAKTYLNNYCWNQYPKIEEIITEVDEVVGQWKNCYSEYWNEYDYSKNMDLERFQYLEKKQRQLKEDLLFKESVENNCCDSIRNYYLFTLNYSGTYWSFRQCIWIDSLKAVIERYRNNPEYYNILIACTMYAMAYNSQSTGHYAQYRKAENDKSMNDILIYRNKTMDSFFKRKYLELRENLTQECGEYITTNLECNECIDNIPEGTLIYADPPYCSVHYSRFYHAIETFVRYDYPNLKYDGRYRDDRYQSPFCISTKVENAFESMFEKIKNRDCELVLSYSNSNTSMIDLNSIIIDAYCIFNDIEKEKILDVDMDINNMIEEEGQLGLEEININISSILDENIDFISEYEIILKMFQHKHSTLGRTEEKSLDVLETLVLVKKRG